MTRLTMDLPDSVVRNLRDNPKELAADLRLMAALKMFELGRLSSGGAAELAGVSRLQFLDACTTYKVPVFNYPEEQLEAELKSDVETVRDALL